MNWEFYFCVFDVDVGVIWVKDLFWVFCIIECDGKYYFYYIVNNFVLNEIIFGMGVVVVDTLVGLFIDIIDELILWYEVNGGNLMD